MIKMQRSLETNVISLCVVAACLLVTMISHSVFAAEKEYPTRPINMVVGFNPGGGSDLASRIMADKISPFLRQPLISVYKPGGDGALAASLVAKSKPDGYTLLVMVSFMNAPPELKKVDFTMDDFIPTGIFYASPNFFVVKADSRWKTIKDFVEEAKKSPGKLSYSSTGPGTSGFFTYSLFAKYSGIQLSHIPYKSCGDAMTALLGGHVDAYFCVGVGAIDSQLVRPLATAEMTRLEGWPEIPTFAESGYPKVLYNSFISYVFPKGTPQNYVDKVATAQKKAYEQFPEEIKQGFKRIQGSPANVGPQETVQEFKNHYDLIQTLMREAKVPVK